MSKRHFKRYFEWIGNTIYIRVDGKNTTTQLDDLLMWYHDNQYNLGTTSVRLNRLIDQLNTLQDKHARLLDYLELEDTISPEFKVVHKIKTLLPPQDTRSTVSDTEPSEIALKEIFKLYAPELNENQIKLLIRKIGEI